MYVVVALAFLLSACTSTRTFVASPMESDINGEKYHYHNLVVLQARASMFHVTESRSWMEFCKSKIENPVTQEQWDYPYADCVMHSQYMANGAPSVAQQAITPVVTTAIGATGFVLGMQALGKGIAKSGDRTTNNNSTSSEGGSGGTGGDATSSSKASGGKATNNVNSGNKSVNNSVNNSKSTTNITQNNKTQVQMKFNQHLNNH